MYYNLLSCLGILSPNIVNSLSHFIPSCLTDKVRPRYDSHSADNNHHTLLSRSRLPSEYFLVACTAVYWHYTVINEDDASMASRVGMFNLKLVVHATNLQVPELDVPSDCPTYFT
ncbi:hypothetical protein BDW42DRAFT_168733 [Aspergillus taichungensis]|uniref:Uncharacterized protein n=1 Tax=Aspergillus taichungensis TaxID=482145 RepID=A0A2J5HW81_9EURO|nr:hypothetical protein BDW42DRAFT_168733 [Aspergillus taichungensis]